MSDKQADLAEQPFEEQMARLEEIVQTLEEGDVPLEESLRLFEEGIRLAASCNKQLSEIEGRLEMLVHSADGGLEVEPFSFEDDVEGKATS